MKEVTYLSPELAREIAAGTYPLPVVIAARDQLTRALAKAYADTAARLEEAEDRRDTWQIQAAARNDERNPT